VSARAIKRVVEFCDNVLLRNRDGIALNLQSTYGELLRILVEHAQGEGAVETLERIVRERDKAQRIVDEVSRRAAQAARVEFKWHGENEIKIENMDRVVVKRSNPFGDGTTGNGAA
jgi:hypothetical protein